MDAANYTPRSALHRPPKWHNESSVLEQVDLIILQCTKGILLCYTVIIKGQKKKKKGQIYPLPECETHVRWFVIATADRVKILETFPVVFI